MKKVRRKRHPVVDLVRVSAAGSASPSPRVVHAVAQNAQPVPKNHKAVCPLCRQRIGTVEVSIGVVNVRVCEPCSDPVFKGIQFLGALSRFL